MLPPVQTNTKMSAFNVDVSSFFSNVVLGKHWKKGKQEESTTLVTNQHINLSSSPPKQQPQQRVQSIQSQKWAGGLTGVGEAWRMSESYPHIAGSCPATQHYSPLRPRATTLCTPGGHLCSAPSGQATARRGATAIQHQGME
jgi:hypothetical protein